MNPTVSKYTSSGAKKFKLGGILTPYNCPDNDSNIKKVTTFFVRDNNKSIENASDLEYQNFKDNIIDKLNDGNYANNTTSYLSISLYPNSDQIYTSKIPGFIYTANGLLTNKNRVNLTANMSESSVKGNTIYQMQAMYYDAINPLTGEKYGWILGDNMIKYKFDSNCNYTITDIAK